jgi:hypothetical protein
VANLADDGGGAQVEQRNCLKIEQIGNHLAPFGVDASRNEVWLHVFGAAGAQRFISAVFYQGELARIGDHAKVGAAEVKLLVACSLPVDFAGEVGLDICDDESFEGVADRIAIVVEVNLGDFKSIVAFEHAFLGLSLDLNKNLTWRHIIEQILSFFELLDARIIDIHRPAKISCHQLASVVLPADGSYGIVILNIFASIFLPLSSLGVQVIHVKSVEVSDGDRIP